MSPRTARLGAPRADYFSLLQPHHGHQTEMPADICRDPGTGPNTVTTPAAQCLRVSPSAPPQGCVIPCGHRRGSYALSPVPSPAAKLQERGATRLVAMSSAPARQPSSSMHLRDLVLTRRPDGDPRGCTPLLQLRCGRGAGGEGVLPPRVHPSLAASLRERGRGRGRTAPTGAPLSCSFAAGEGPGERADYPRWWPHEIAHPLGDARRDG
jgi:hypothetical protein